MLITPSNLSLIFTSFSLLYQGAFTEAEIFWRTLAMLVPSSTESSTYAWMENLPAMREWIGPRVVENVVARGPRVLINRKFESTISVPKDKILDDQYGVYSPMAASMGQQAAKWPDDVIRDCFLANPIAWDDVAYFAAGHPVKYGDTTMGSYSTLMTGMPLNVTNFGLARAAMRARKGANGRFMGIKPDLLVVGPKLEQAAEQLLNSQYYPKLADGASLGAGDVGIIENPWRGAADLLVIDDLDDVDSGLGWYLFDTKKPVKPFLFQLREAPAFTYLNNPSDPNVFWNSAFVMGCEARGAGDVTLPQLAMKCTP